MSKEPFSSSEQTYSAATHALTHLARYDMLDAGDHAFPEWQRSGVRRFKASEPVASVAQMGQDVRLTVNGNTEMGVAIILKPRSILSRQRYGFFIQPEQGNTFSVWHGPAKSDGQLSWVGAQSLDYNKAVQADPTLANSFVNDLIANAGNQDLMDEDIG